MHTYFKIRARPTNARPYLLALRYCRTLFPSSYKCRLRSFSASLIRFAQQEGSLETPAGTAARLPCRTTSPVRECQWSWRQLNQSQPWDAEMRKFPASGNESTVCDLGLPAVRSEHEGFWTCGARVVSSSPFVQAPPIRLLISEGMENFISSSVCSESM